MWGISSHFWIEEVDFGRVCFILHLSRIFVEVSRDHVSVIFVVFFFATFGYLRVNVCLCMDMVSGLGCSPLAQYVCHVLCEALSCSCARHCHSSLLRVS